MPKSPSRIATEEEQTTALLAPGTQDDLEANEHENEPQPHFRPRGSSSSSWQFSIQPPFVRRVHFAEFPSIENGQGSSSYHDDEDNDEQLGDVQPHKRHHHRHHHEERNGWNWQQGAMYLFLLLVGGGIGVIFTKNLGSRTDDLGDGPMVPPVWTLPPPTGLPRNEAYLVNGTSGAVASEDKTCSDLGLSILRDKNGSAVDSAITTTLCIGLLNAFSSGIGGGGFMVIRIPEDYSTSDDSISVRGLGLKEDDEKVIAIDFRETSPAQSDKDMYGTDKAGRVAAQVGGLAVGVPGELRGLEEAHKLYGKLPWEEVVMPVAKLAKGWKVSRELARRLRLFGQFMLDNPTWSKVYAPRGPLLVEGDFVQRLNYGRTLETIAKYGVGAFYEGDIAQKSVRTVQRAGGVLSLDDLKSYKARTYPAIHSSFMGKEVYTTDAPSSGGILLGLLNILEPYAIPSSGGLNDPLNQHRFIEAMKFAFGARSEITDPVFASNLSRFAEFTTKGWADEIRSKITDNETHPAEYYGLQFDTPTDHGTTHLSVVDQWGGAASVTSTVNLIWGSHVMDPDTGIIFNDEQDDFSVPGAPNAFGLWPSPWNYPAPGKRPLSSTSATILLNPSKPYVNSSLYAVLGGSGGSRIFPSVAQVILNLFTDPERDISKAIEAYRTHNQIFPNLTTVEVGPEGYDDYLVEGLKDRGQEIGGFDVNIGISEVQGIVIENGTIFAASDSRKNGIASSY